MAQKVIVTCAVTGGNAAVVAKHPKIPITPSQIADAALDAAKTGAGRLFTFMFAIHRAEPHRTGSISMNRS